MVPTHPTLSAVQLRASTGGSYGGTTQLSSAQSHDSLMFASQLSHGQHLTEGPFGRASGRYSDLEIVGSPYSLRLLRVLTCRDFATIFSNDTSCVTLLSSIIVLQPISTSNYCDLKLVPWRRASTWSSLALVRLTASRWHHFFLSNVGRILRVVRSEDVPRMRTRCQLKDIRFGETSLIPAGRGCIIAGTNSST
jgi:hypothetical protein